LDGGTAVARWTSPSRPPLSKPLNFPQRLKKTRPSMCSPKGLSAMDQSQFKKPLTELRVNSSLRPVERYFWTEEVERPDNLQFEQYKKIGEGEQVRRAVTVNLELGVLKAMLRKAQQWGSWLTILARMLTVEGRTEGANVFLPKKKQQLLWPNAPRARRIVATGLLTGFVDKNSYTVD